MFFETATLVLMIELVLSDIDFCNKTCVYLSLCPPLQYHLANPNQTILMDLEKSICDINDEVTVCCDNSFDTLPEDKESISGLNDCGRQDSVYEHPWMVSFVAVGWSLCSGALINPRYVLTAASCAIQNDIVNILITLHLGDFNLKNNNTNCSDVTGLNEKECSNIEMFHIEEAVPHPLHNGTFNDIGLIRLDRAVQFSEYIRPICLPTSNLPNYLQPDDRLFTSRFIVWFDPIIERNRFKENVATSVITLEACREWFKQKGMKVPLSVFNICSVDVADLTGFVNYFVDHGGPVMRFYNDQWYVVAVLSLAIEDGDPGRPVIHTNISYYLDWILGNMRL